MGWMGVRPVIVNNNISVMAIIYIRISVAIIAVSV